MYSINTRQIVNILIYNLRTIYKAIFVILLLN